MNCPRHNRGFRVESLRRRRRWRASLAGFAGGRRWRASLAGVAGGAAQKHREIQLRRLKHHTPPKRETRTAHFERRQHARDKQPSADQRHRRFPITARARAKTTKGVEPANRRMTRQRSRVNRHAQTQPQTDHQTRKNRREPTSFWKQPGTQANQTKESRLRPQDRGRSFTRLTSTDGPTEGHADHRVRSYLSVGRRSADSKSAAHSGSGAVLVVLLSERRTGSLR